MEFEPYGNPTRIIAAWQHVRRVVAGSWSPEFVFDLLPDDGDRWTEGDTWRYCGDTWFAWTEQDPIRGITAPSRRPVAAGAAR